MERAVSSSSLPPPASLGATDELEKAGRVAHDWFYPYSSMFLSDPSQVIVREASTQASLRLATTAFAVERFRHGQGRLPADLNELTPQFLANVPTDPFDGAPLRYRRLSRGYLIYSVGIDRRDNGGREGSDFARFSDMFSYDITFIGER